MRIPVTIDSRLRISLDDLDRADRETPGERSLLELLQAAFVHENPDYAKQRRYGFVRRGTKPVIGTWRLEDGCLTLPRGGTGRVREVLGQRGHTWAWSDLRQDGDPQRQGQVPAHRVELWDFQRELVRTVRERQNCLVRAPAGSGKTTAMFALIAELNLPALVVVWTANLLDQWLRRCEREFGLARSEVGVIRGSERRVRPITIGMQQTLEKCIADYHEAFGVLVCDEVHRFAARTFMAVVDASPARYRIGVSNDERRSDRKEFLIYDVFGDVAGKVEHATLVQAGIIHEVQVRVVVSDFDAVWWRRLRDACAGSGPAAKMARRKLAQAWDRLSEEMGADRSRNELLLTLARRCRAEGEQVLLFSHRREHCHRLDALLQDDGFRSGLLIGGQDYAQQFELTRTGVEAGELDAACGTYQAVGTGFDVPRVARAVCATPVANDKDGRMQFEQYRGRVARTTRDGMKHDAVLYYVLDRTLYGSRPLRHLVRWNKHVVVLQGDQWVDGRQALKEWQSAEAERGSEGDDTAGGLFVGG